MTDTLSPVVRLEAADGVGTITLDRPRVNAYEIGLMTQLREAVAAADADANVPVVVLRSANPGLLDITPSGLPSPQPLVMARFLE